MTRAEWNEYLPESLQVGLLIYPLKGKMIEALVAHLGMWMELLHKPECIR